MSTVGLVVMTVILVILAGSLAVLLKERKAVRQSNMPQKPAKTGQPETQVSDVLVSQKPSEWEQAVEEDDEDKDLAAVLKDSIDKSVQEKGISWSEACLMAVKDCQSQHDAEDIVSALMEIGGMPLPELAGVLSPACFTSEELAEALVANEIEAKDIFYALFPLLPGADLKQKFAAFFTMVQEAEDTNWGEDSKDSEFLEELISAILKSGYKLEHFLSALLENTEYNLGHVITALPTEFRPEAACLGGILKESGINLQKSDELDSLRNVDDFTWEETIVILRSYGYSAEQAVTAWIDYNGEDLSEEIEQLLKAGYGNAETLLAVNSATQDYSTAELVQAAYELKLPDEDIASFLKDPQTNIMGSLDEFESELSETDLPMSYRVNLMYKLLNP